jgi:hypothetical protein
MAQRSYVFAHPSVNNNNNNNNAAISSPSVPVDPLLTSSISPPVSVSNAVADVGNNNNNLSNNHLHVISNPLHDGGLIAAENLQNNNNIEQNNFSGFHQNILNNNIISPSPAVDVSEHKHEDNNNNNHNNISGFNQNILNNNNLNNNINNNNNNNNNNNILFDKNSGSNQNFCGMSIAAIKADYNTLLGEPCPLCKQLLYLHKEPDKIINNQISGFNQKFSDNNKFDNDNKIYLNLVKCLPHFPKWDEKSVCYLFIQKVELQLNNLGFAPAHWTKILPLLIADTAAGMWVRTNIIEPKLEWSAAVKLFTKHFQSSDYEIKLTADYNSIKQSSTESIQQYSDRFVVLCGQLALDADTTMVINHYEQSICDAIRKQYHTIRIVKQIDDELFRITTLQQLIRICVHIDTSNKTLNNDKSLVSTKNNKNKNSGFNQKFSDNNNNADTVKQSGLKCEHHPQFDNHTTAQCRITIAAANGNNAVAPVPVKKDLSKIICHRCSKPGHYANNCSLAAPSTPGGPSAAVVPAATPFVRPIAGSNIVNKALLVTKHSNNNLSLDRSISNLVHAPLQYICIVYNGVIYSMLLDSGCTHSMVSQNFALENFLVLTKNFINPISITLADGSGGEHVGTTSPLQLQFVFNATGNKLPDVLVTHSFEVMPFGVTDYDFIIGGDLISTLFPTTVPVEYLLRAGAHASVGGVVSNVRVAAINYGESPQYAHMDSVISNDCLINSLQHLTSKIKNKNSGFNQKVIFDDKCNDNKIVADAGGDGSGSVGDVVSDVAVDNITNNNINKNHNFSGFNQKIMSSGIGAGAPGAGICGSGVANGVADGMISDAAVGDAPVSNITKNKKIKFSGFNQKFVSNSGVAVAGAVSGSHVADAAADGMIGDAAVRDATDIIFENKISGFNQKFSENILQSNISGFNQNILVNENQHVADVDGGVDGVVGEIPVNELPIKPHVYTAAELESYYAPYRDAIYSDPVIIELLLTNARITGFCVLPDCVVVLDIDPTKASKLFTKQYSIALAARPFVTDIVDRWLAEGKIELAPPGTRFNSSIVAAAKKDDNGNYTAVRVCLDFRPLNLALTVFDNFAIPHIRAALDVFGGCMMYGEIDLSEAYLQFPLHPNSRQYTAFTWNNVQYQFVGCPFGLSLLPSHFQRIMSTIFHDLPYTFPYLDNLPIGSKSWNDHKQHIIVIIDRLNKANLKIKSSSFKIGQSHIKLLGHLVSVNGVGIDPAKLQAIASWERPVTGRELQQFLGFAVFIRSNIRNFSEITGPLESVKNNVTIDWTDELVECFNTTKIAIANAPFLAFPNPSKRFVIACDASNTGVGGVLYQPDEITGFNQKNSGLNQNFSEKNNFIENQISGFNQKFSDLQSEIIIPSDVKLDAITATNMVAICSKKLSKCQQNYSAYKKELFAIIYCLRQFHTYVWGRCDLVIYTDHKPLTYMLESIALSNALQLWLDVLLDYKFVITHRPGVLNVVPDALSRMYRSLYAGNSWGVVGANLIGGGVGSNNVHVSVVTRNQNKNLVLTKNFKKNKKIKISGLNQNIISNSTDAVAGAVAGAGSAVADGVADGMISDAAIGGITNGKNKNKKISGFNQKIIFTNNITDDIQVATDSLQVADEVKQDVTAAVTDSEISGLNQNFSEQKINDENNLVLTKNKIISPIDLAVELEKRGKRSPATEAEKVALIELEHALGHFGRDAIYTALWNKNWWWFKMRSQILEVIRECDACMAFVVVQAGYHPAKYITACNPFDHIQMDCKVHLPLTTDGHTALLVIVDVATGFAILRPLITTSAACVAEQLWDVFSTFGLPKIIQSDNGREFVNEIISLLIKLTGVEHRLISPYNPRADGKVERTIGTVVSILKKLLHGSKQHWNMLVPFVQFSYNQKYSTLTGSTPFSLMFGRMSNQMMDYSTAPINKINIDDWKKHQEKLMSVIYPGILQRATLSKDKMILHLNKVRRQLTENSFPVGCSVYLINQDKDSKLTAPYVGTYTVSERTYRGNYILKDSTGKPLDRAVPGDQLKLQSKKINFNKNKQQYVVETILDHRSTGVAGAYEYLVQWLDYEETTWEPAHSFANNKTIENYWKSIQLQE